MFQDKSTQWQPFPTTLDELSSAPYVKDCGLSRDGLILVAHDDERAFGVEIGCEFYFGLEELFYSLGRLNENCVHIGGVFVKEARQSALLDSFEAVDPHNRKFRHFLFVGSDFCYETIGDTEPRVMAFARPEEAYRWAEEMNA